MKNRRYTPLLALIIVLLMLVFMAATAKPGMIDAIKEYSEIEVVNNQTGCRADYSPSTGHWLVYRTEPIYREWYSGPNEYLATFTLLFECHGQ